MRAIAFNGATASLIGRRAMGGVFAGTVITLPSSSPAYTLAFGAKRTAWLGLRAFLGARG